MQMTTTLPYGVASHQAWRRHFWLPLLKNSQDGGEQLLLGNRLGEIGSNAKFTASRGIARLSSRGQHHDGEVTQVALLAELLDQRETIDFGHLNVDEDQIKG